MTIPQSVQALVGEKQTLTSALIEASSQGNALSPEQYIQKLSHQHSGVEKKKSVPSATDADLQTAKQLGRFNNTQPSDLFLKVGWLSGYAFFLVNEY